MLLAHATLRTRGAALVLLMLAEACVPPTDKPVDTPADDSTPPVADDSSPPTDSGHSSSPDDSSGEDSGGTGGDSGGGDTGGDSTPPDDTGIPSGDGDIDLDCDGSKDDGRAIKLCWPESEVTALDGGPSRCDVNGDSVPDLLVMTSMEGVLLINDFSRSREVDESLLVVGESTYGFGGEASCGGDRDGDGYEDLLVRSVQSSYSYYGSIFAFDGPVVSGTTSDDASGVLYHASGDSWMNKLVWVQGAGDDGGDGVLMGGDDPYEYSYGSYSYAWLQGDLVGEHEIESSRASFTTDAAEDLAVGAGLRSADMDGDGTAEVLIGIADGVYDDGYHTWGAIMYADADSSGATDWDDNGYSYDAPGIYAVLGSRFTTGDIDQDGYTDVVGLVDGHTSYDSRSLVTVYYHPDLSDNVHGTSGADALLDLSTSDLGPDQYPILPGDFNADGSPGDLVVANHFGLYFFYEPPSGVMTQDDSTHVTVYDPVQLWNPTEVGDLSGDGIDDLALVGLNDYEVYDHSGAIYVLFGGSW